MRDLYFYSLILGVGAGAALSPQGHLNNVPTLLWLVSLTLVVALVLWRHTASKARPYLIAGVLAVSAFLLITLRVESVLPPSVPVLEAKLGEVVTIEGVVAREPDRRERTTHLYLTTDEATILAFVDRYEHVSYGDRVTVKGTLERPTVFTTELGRTFNYPDYLRARGVTYTLSFATVLEQSPGQGNPIVQTLLRAKQAFLNSLQRQIPEPQLGLAAGMLLGLKQGLSDEYETAFRDTGLMHIVVLSGYNVMLVVAFFMYVLAFLLPYRARLIVGMVGITCFALLVGLSATVVRASIMAALLLLVRFGGMTHQLLRALLLAGALMLLANPLLLLYDIGFQLSFVATLALIVAAPLFERLVTWVPEALGLRGFFVATLATQFLVTPLLLFHIGQASLVALIANMLVLPLVPIAMLLAFAAGIVGLFSTYLALPFAFLAHQTLTLILALAAALASVPFSAITIPAFSVWVLLASYGVLVVVLYALRRRQNRTSASAYVPPSLRGWTIVEA